MTSRDITTEELITATASSVYQKIQNLPDEEVRDHLEKAYESILKEIEEANGDGIHTKTNSGKEKIVSGLKRYFTKRTRYSANDSSANNSHDYQKYLKALLNMNNNIDLYNKLDELDWRISQKEQKAYRDLRWFARKGIKLDDDIKEEIFDAYLDGDLKKEVKGIANILGIGVNDVPYATYVLRELLLTNPTADSHDIKEELNYEPPEKKKKSKAKAIAAALLMIGAASAGAVAYNAYEAGKKVKNDGSYFFHHPGDYLKYVSAKDKNDIDGDGIPNTIEEKYGLNMFDAKDAKEDWDGDGLTNYQEIMIYNLDIKNPDMDKDGLKDGDEVLKYHTDPLNNDTDNDGYNDSYEVKVPGLNPNNPDVDHDGLLDGKDSDGDGFTNWFERNKMMTDPLVKNERYAVITTALDSTYFLPGMNGTGMRDFLIKEFGYKPQNIILLDQKQASFTNFKKAIDEMKNKVTPDDILLVIMAAHGQPNIIHIYESAWYGDVADLLKDIKAERLITTIDACYSGTAIDFFKNTTFESPLLLYTSTDKKNTNSVTLIDFTLKNLIDVKSDFNKDKFVSFYEAYLKNKKGGAFPQKYDPSNIANNTYLGEKAVIE